MTHATIIVNELEDGKIEVTRYFVDGTPSEKFANAMVDLAICPWITFDKENPPEEGMYFVMWHGKGGFEVPASAAWIDGKWFGEGHDLPFVTDYMPIPSHSRGVKQ